MNNAMSLEDLRDKLSLLLATQSPHLPTNVTDINLTDGYRTVELEVEESDQISELEDDLDHAHRKLNHAEAECDDLHDDVRGLRVELAGRDAEIAKLQQDIINLGQQLNAVLSR